MEFRFDKFGNKYKVENGFLIQENRWGRIDRFEIVDKIPNGYVIWNIGKNMVDNYLPLVKILDNYNVDLTTMKAIEWEESQIILAGVYGGNTLESLRKRIEKIDKGIIKDRYNYNKILMAIESLEKLMKVSEGK